MLRFIFSTISIFFFIFYACFDTLIYLKIMSIIFLLIAIFSDFLDGWLARKWNVISNFGEYWDPIVDKFLVLIYFAIFIIVLFFKNKLPIHWKILMSIIIVVLIIRDFLINLIRVIKKKHNLIIPASKIAKLKTVSQMIVIFMAICLDVFTGNNNEIKNITIFLLFLLSACFSYISFIKYLQEIKNFSNKSLNKKK